MKVGEKAIIATNPHIYYYASLVDRIYGFVLRREGKNLPRERYVGRLAQEPRSKELAKYTDFPGSLHARRSGDPAIGEILLFRYRKRLLLGYCQGTLGRTGPRICVLTEDRRHLRFRRDSIVFLTGLTISEDPACFSRYAASARELAEQIDLREVWEVATGETRPLTVADIGGLYWGEPIDGIRWVALYLCLDHANPYFSFHKDGTCLPLSEAEVVEREHQRGRRESRSQEMDELTHWFEVGKTDPYEPETLTERQQNWLEQVRQYALWGRKASGSEQACRILSALCPGKRDLRRVAFDLLVAKGIWSEDENLDLHRESLPTDFSEPARRMAKALNLETILAHKGRMRLRGRQLFSVLIPGIPEVAFSLKRRWWGVNEIGIHIPDIAAYVPAGSSLDRDASDRMAELLLPDRRYPMLPLRVSDCLGRVLPGERRPALSLLIRLDRMLHAKRIKLLSTVIANGTVLSWEEAEAICGGNSHPLGDTFRTLGQLADRLKAARKPLGQVLSPSPDIHVHLDAGRISLHRDEGKDRTRAIIGELLILAATEIGKWCARQQLPVLYEVGGALEDLGDSGNIVHPVVRRHETQRQIPFLSLDPRPGMHDGLGVSSYCTILTPGARYCDLVVQQQIGHYLHCGEILHGQDRLAYVRYRAQEELAQLANLTRRRERYWLLKHLAGAKGETFRAVVLYIRRDGVLVELLDRPLKTVVHPGRELSIGEEIDVRLTGVDLSRSRAHFTVL